MKFFFTYDPDYALRLSPCPELDRPDGTRALAFLTPGLPLGLARVVLENARRQVRPNWLARCGLDGAVRRLGPAGRSGMEWSQREPRAAVLRALAASGLPAREWAWQEIRESRDLAPELLVKEEVFSTRVRGRQLSEGDLTRLGRELGLLEEDVLRLAELAVQSGAGEWVPALVRETAGWRCQRCGSKQVEEWPDDWGTAATCLSCTCLGSLTSRQALYRDRRRILVSSAFRFQPVGELNSAQAAAAEQLLDFMRGKESEALLWAACGAGKTEVCFPAIAWALSQGRAVLFAAPRQDVVHDVAPRLAAAFPGLSAPVLTGASSRRFAAGELVLATTHQVLRFHQAFEVIILDEMDAFPYAGGPMLAWGLQRALAPGGKILYLSATPAPEILQRARRGACRLIRLPARYHRRPLPVPRWVKLTMPWGAAGLSQCPPALAAELEKLVAHGPVLLFVPEIPWVERWVAVLRQTFPAWRIDGSWSADGDRQAKTARLRRGEYEIFITTSILERGVTIRGAQVLVLAADHAVFGLRGLVQMAGRAGRTADFPGGEVVFAADRRSRAVVEAIRWIEEQNRLAAAEGLLD